MRRTAICIVGLVVAGCGNVSTRPDYMVSKKYQAREALSASLFPADQAALSNEAIEKILSAKIVLPAKARLAVVRIVPGGHRWWWLDEPDSVDRDIAEGFLAKLRACDRLADVSFLPSLMLPKKQTIPYLREAAARYQADLLLIYRSASRTYRKSRFLAADETRAYCTVEAVLLDVRTGVVPFTSVATQEYTTKASPEDVGFADTMRRAERKAFGQAMDRIAADLVRFLETVPGP